MKPTRPRAGTGEEELQPDGEHLLLGISNSVKGQHHVKGGPAADFACGPGMPPVPGHDPPHIGQPDPRALESLTVH
ncbi:MAG: hypothetical protein JWQ08_2953, partial [Deinococcus sp.]|nr:hypothetical protein [Deinococcus sp.]